MQVDEPGNDGLSTAVYLPGVRNVQGLGRYSRYFAAVYQNVDSTVLMENVLQ
jgi:hypothetical protein